MKKISVISLDYDGCASFLFEENVEGILSKFLMPYWENRRLNPETNPRDRLELNSIFADEESKTKLMAAARNVIKQVKEDLMSKILEKTAADSVILMVGSNRQDHALDIYNSYAHHTISCFDALRSFATEKGMEFSTFLLGDHYDIHGNLLAEPKPIGHTMSSERPIFSFTEDRNAIVKRIKPFGVSPRPKDKFLLIKAQLAHVAQLFSSEEHIVSYTFFDDLLWLVQFNQKQLDLGKFELPPHINCEFIYYESTLHLIKLMQLEIKKLFEELISNDPEPVVLVKRRRESLFDEASEIHEVESEHPTIAPPSLK